MNALKVIFPVLLLAVALGACREGEQGRQLTFEPGVYPGEKEAALADDVMRALRQRALRQGRDFAVTLGGAAASPHADVRPPASAALDWTALRDRAAGQKN